MNGFKNEFELLGKAKMLPLKLVLLTVFNNNLNS